MLNNYIFRQLCCFIKKHPEVIGGAILTLSKYRFPSYADCCEIAQEVGIQFNIDEDYIKDKFSVDKIILSSIGFSKVNTMDNSAYEGADIIHDLNIITDDYNEKYDLVLDAGTMEHIFSFPQVLENVYKMLKQNGAFFFTAPYWYHPFHGYYAFSQELLEDYFLANKWDIVRMQPFTCPWGKESIELPAGKTGTFPAAYGLLNGIVIKTKSTSCNIIPQQCEYTALWDNYDRMIMHLKKYTESKYKCVNIFGTGETTRSIVNIIKSINPCIRIEIYSDNPSEIGIPIIYGITVNSLDGLEAGDVLLIGSINYQDTIADRISYLETRNVSIVKLF